MGGIISESDYDDVGLNNIKRIEDLCEESLELGDISGSYNYIKICNKDENTIIRVSKLPAIQIINDEYYITKKINLEYLKNTFKIWNKANEEGLTPYVYFNGYIKINDKDLHYAIVTEKYDHDLYNYYKMKNISINNNGEDDEDYEVANTLIELFSKMYEKLKIICFDIKLRNTVINMENGKIKKFYNGSLDIRLIDWDGDFCLTGPDYNDIHKIYKYDEKYVLYLNVLLMGSHFIYHSKRHVFKQFYIKNKDELYDCKYELMDIFVKEGNYSNVVKNYFMGYSVFYTLYDLYYIVYKNSISNKSTLSRYALFEFIYYSMKLGVNNILTYLDNFNLNNDENSLFMEPILIEMKIKAYRNTKDRTKKSHVNVLVEQFSFCKKYEINKCIFNDQKQRFLYKLHYEPKDIEYSSRFSIRSVIRRTITTKSMSKAKIESEDIYKKLPSYFAYIGTKSEISNFKKSIEKLLDGTCKEVNYQDKKLLLFKCFNGLNLLCEKEIESAESSVSSNRSSRGGVKVRNKRNRKTKKNKKLIHKKGL
jgi:hypothetical protein